MKTIRINNKKIDLTVAEERALRILAACDFAASPSEFEEGSRRWRKYILPRGDRAVALGVSTANRDIVFRGPKINAASRKRADKYFASHPRRRVCVIGDPRKINAILKQVG